MADQDFRYVFNGEEVEAYQITEASRYQQKLWPDWMDSRQFMTIDGLDWLVIGSEEMPIPQYGWLVKHIDGRITIADALAFDKADKVVPNVVEPEPQPTDTAVAIPSQPDDEFLSETRIALEMMLAGSLEEGRDHLTKLISKQTTWCNCVPGQCEKLDPWTCREKSPLVKKRRKPRKRPDDLDK